MNAAFNAPFRKRCREVSKVGHRRFFVHKYADQRAARRVFGVSVGILQLFYF